MNRKVYEMPYYVANIAFVILIVASFLVSALLIRNQAREECFERIDDTAEQAVQMLNRSITNSQEKLTVFADILAENSENPENLLLAHMENFCQTHYVSSICIRRADGTTISYGEHPHDANKTVSFDEEKNRLPYISEIVSMKIPVTDRTGESTLTKYFFYQAVPVIRAKETVAILYGYTSLDYLPKLVSTTAYDNSCEIRIVDGNSAMCNILMDTGAPAGGTLGNLYDTTAQSYEIRSGYSLQKMRDDTHSDLSGYFVFRSPNEGEWLYTHYVPTGINHWSLHLTVNESAAFENYNQTNTVILVLAIGILIFALLHMIVLMLERRRDKARDQARLQRSRYMYDVQQALFNAHNNPDFIRRALRRVAEEMAAQTVLLLTFSDKIVKNIYFWPSQDKMQAFDMLDRNIRDDFPILFDQLSENQSVVYDEADQGMRISETAQAIFRNLEVSNIILVPIIDHAGVLKGAICSANMEKVRRDPSVLECVAYDFFMAIMNIENHDIIKNMGTMDYLTNIKNRNSYESDLATIATTEASNLWCVFIDVNGLHEINNTRGHKAGDLMLCAVADAVKRTFGTQHTYRVGGDEFVAFVQDTSKEALLRKSASIEKALGTMDYHVSIGFAGAERIDDVPFNIETIVSDAEAIMYREKKAYYEKNHLIHEREYTAHQDSVTE